MLPVKTVIPPNNDLLFSHDGTFMKFFCDGKPRKIIRFGIQLSVGKLIGFLWMGVINGDG